MSREDATKVLLGGLTFPEGPRWRDGKLWFSDFYSHRVLRVGLGGRAETVVEVPQRPSGLGWTRDGALLLRGGFLRQGAAHGSRPSCLRPARPEDR